MLACVSYLKGKVGLEGAQTAHSEMNASRRRLASTRSLPRSVSGLQVPEHLVREASRLSLSQGLAAPGLVDPCRTPTSGDSPTRLGSTRTEWIEKGTTSWGTLSALSFMSLWECPTLCHCWMSLWEFPTLCRPRRRRPTGGHH